MCKLLAVWAGFAIDCVVRRTEFLLCFVFTRVLVTCFSTWSEETDCDSSIVQLTRHKIQKLNNLIMCNSPVLIWWMLWCWDLPVLQERKRRPVVQFASHIINKTKQTVKYNRPLRVTSRKLMRQLRSEKLKTMKVKGWVTFVARYQTNISNLHGNYTWCYKNFMNNCRILKQENPSEGGDVSSSKKWEQQVHQQLDC